MSAGRCSSGISYLREPKLRHEVVRRPGTGTEHAKVRLIAPHVTQARPELLGAIALDEVCALQNRHRSADDEPRAVTRERHERPVDLIEKRHRAFLDLPPPPLFGEPREHVFTPGCSLSIQSSSLFAAPRRSGGP